MTQPSKDPKLDRLPALALRTYSSIRIIRFRQASPQWYRMSAPAGSIPLDQAAEVAGRQAARDALRVAGGDAGRVRVPLPEHVRIPQGIRKDNADMYQQIYACAYELELPIPQASRGDSVRAPRTPSPAGQSYPSSATYGSNGQSRASSPSRRPQYPAYGYGVPRNNVSPVPASSGR